DSSRQSRYYKSITTDQVDKEVLNMDKVLEKEDFKEFIKIALELKNSNKEVFEGYKNRMLGAIEVQKLAKS
ncbi:hypothetical protein QUV80_13300, partial [Paraclostridium benzoelyticum]|nr:hypothetical protein [Paraclostridium benzoelyticum]